MRWALPLIVLGAALRFWFAATAGSGLRDDGLRPDERDRYLPIARSLREGEGFAIAGRPTAQSMPLWPAVLSLLPAGEQGRWLAALFSTLALPVAWAVGRKLAEPKIALLALALLAVDLDQAVLGGSILAEPLFTLLLCLFALAWAHGRVGWAALALAAAVLTRPEAALIPFALAAFGREWRRPLVLLAAVAIAVAPWAHRNQRVFGTFVPLTSTAGIAFHSGMNAGDLELPFRKRGEARNVKYRHARDLAGQGIEVTYSRTKLDEALAFARERPGAAAGILLSKFLQLWTPLQRKGTSAVYALATLLSWWAVWRGVRFRPALVGPMLVVMTLVGLAFLSIPRYRAPYHPYMFLLAASAPWRRR
ncbi:MAG TPA: hypothetical protein VFY93_14875 [Planctomycetota bacterium]|nr:hypothetical protein [Planctomycetota bacterium]